MPDLDFLRHIKKLVILAMFSDDSLMDRLVLKGGNLLDVVYELSARASVDVDLSMEDEFEDVDELRQKVLRALETTFSEHGYTVFDFSLKAVPPKMTDDIKDFWGGYQVEFKIIEQEKYGKFQDNLDTLRRNAANIGNRGSTVFKVDISRHEFCEEKEQFLLDDYSIYGYSPVMFVAEKLRAICQQMPEYVQIVHLNPRPRARDFLDIQIVSEHYAIDWTSDYFQATVSKTFAKKKVPFHLLGQLPDVGDQHADDFQAVQVTVKPDFPLQDFEYYFDYVCDKAESLEALWNV